jgi:PAS fold
MSAVDELPGLDWHTSIDEFSARRRLRHRKRLHIAMLVRVLVAVAAGMLVSHLLTSNSTLGAACTIIAVAVAFPVVSGWFLNDRLRRARAERRFLRRHALPESQGKETEIANKTPAGLLIVSSDLRVRFANYAYLDSTFQNLEDVVGWRLEDVMPAEGLEEQAKALLNRSYAATSCCFTSIPGRTPAELHPVSITMTRIPPVEGEERILVVVEDLPHTFPACQVPLVEGYIC